MSDPRLLRVVLAHLLAVVTEWTVTVGVLVHAYAWGGSTAVGIVSLAVLAPPFVGAPLAAVALARVDPLSVRLAGFAIQTVAFAGAAVSAGADAPSPVVAAFVVVGLAALSTLRPTEAVLLPHLVRSTRELVTGNLFISYGDSSSALLGPLTAALLAAVGGPTAVFAGCAIGVGVSLLVSAWRADRSLVGRPLAVPTEAGDLAPRRRVMRAAVAELRDRPWSIGVLGVASARNIVIGAFDVLLVIIALENLDLGDGGPGLLAALVGGGAMLSVVVTTLVVRRRRLGPALVVALATTTATCGLLAWQLDAIVVVLVLPVLGICLSSMDNIGRILLQRSTDPRSLGPLFAFVGVVAAAAQLVGSAVAQLLLYLGGIELALAGLAVALALLSIASRRSLRAADDHADVPVVEMSMLVGLPMFASLPTPGLETVARAATRVEVAAGTDVITQGDEGDVFYVVSDGEFEVVMSGERIRSATRGEFFGEVALLANVPRTATVTAKVPGALLAIHRTPFLLAVTGHAPAHSIATDHVRGLRLDPATRLHFTGRDDVHDFEPGS